MPPALPSLHCPGPWEKLACSNGHPLLLPPSRPTRTEPQTARTPAPPQQKLDTRPQPPPPKHTDTHLQACLQHLHHLTSQTLGHSRHLLRPTPQLAQVLVPLPHIPLLTTNPTPHHGAPPSPSHLQTCLQHLHNLAVQVCRHIRHLLRPTPQLAQVLVQCLRGLKITEQRPAQGTGRPRQEWGWGGG